MFLVAEVGGQRVAIVHGDADSLAGWNFSQETLATPSGEQGARAAFDAAEASVFASSHTCLPVLHVFDGARYRVQDALRTATAHSISSTSQVRRSDRHRGLLRKLSCSTAAYFTSRVLG